MKVPKFYFHFASKEAAAQVVRDSHKAIGGLTIGDKHLSISFTKYFIESDPIQQSVSFEGNNPFQRRLCFRGLERGTSAIHIRNALGKFGEIQDVYIKNLDCMCLSFFLCVTAE